MTTLGMERAVQGLEELYGKSPTVEELAVWFALFAPYKAGSRVVRRLIVEVLRLRSRLNTNPPDSGSQECAPG